MEGEEEEGREGDWSSCCATPAFPAPPLATEDHATPPCIEGPPPVDIRLAPPPPPPTPGFDPPRKGKEPMEPTPPTPPPPCCCCCCMESVLPVDHTEVTGLEVMGVRVLGTVLGGAWGRVEGEAGGACAATGLWVAVGEAGMEEWEGFPPTAAATATAAAAAAAFPPLSIGRGGGG